MTLNQPTLVSQYSNQLDYLTFKEAIDLTYDYVKTDIKKQKATKFEKKRWNILNDKYKNAFLRNERIHLFKTCTGSGKSVTSSLWSKYLTKLSPRIEGFVILSPEYENGTDEIERILQNHGDPADFVRFEGKNRLCNQLETIINDKGTKIKHLMKSGISICGYCENECANYETCTYYNNCHRILDEDGTKNWIGVQHQINGILPIYLLHTQEIVLVIDEDFTDAIKISFRYKVNVLKQNKRFLELVLKTLKKEGVEPDDVYRIFVEKFILIIDTFLKDLYTFLTPLNYELLLDLFDDIDTLKGIDDYCLGVLENNAYSLIKNGIISPFKFIFKEICNFIDNYFNEDPLNNKNIDNWVKSAFYKKQNKFEITFLYYDKFLLQKLLNRENIVKIIINDATADKEILDFIFSDSEPIIEHNENWLYDNCEFHQLRKKINKHNDPNRLYAHYPKSSFYYKNTFYYLIDDLKEIFESHKNDEILIVSREIDSKHLKFNGGMSLSDYISTLGHLKYKFAEYPLSGTNLYSNFKVVVLLGRPELPQRVLERQSDLIGMSCERYRTLYSRNLMNQAMGRIFRGSEHKFVYLLTGFDIGTNQPIKSYKNHTEFRDFLKNKRKTKKDNKEKQNIFRNVFKYIKIHKKISIKECQDLLNVSNYKARNILNLYVKKQVLKISIEERGKKVYHL